MSHSQQTDRYKSCCNVEGASRMSRVKRVLCVDDNQGICDAVARLLHAAEVRTAANVAGALALAAVLQFDLFILDISLPDGMGTDLLATLKQRHPDTPAILITTSFDISKEEARQVGAIDLIHKGNGRFVQELLEVSGNVLETEFSIKATR